MTIFNFGIEMQLSDLNIGNIKNGAFFAPSEFLVYKLDNNPKFLTYADADTSQMQMLIQQIDSYRSYSEILTVYTPVKSMRFSNKDLIISAYPRVDGFNKIFNDAEFICTFMEMENVSPLNIDTLLLYMIEKCIQSVTKVLDYLEGTREYVLKQAIGEKHIEITRTTRTSTRARAVNWKFKKLYKVNVPVELQSGNRQVLDPNSLVFLTKNIDFNIQESTFHLQSTIGVYLSDAWQVMVLLAMSMLDVKNLPLSEKRDMMSIIEIEEQMDRSRVDPLVGSIAPILAYWIKTRGYRKEFGFILRHLMMELLKLLDSFQFNILLQMDPIFQMNLDLLVMIYEYPLFVKRDDESQQDMIERKLTYKNDVENAGVTTTYPVYPNGLNTFVLIEFRFMTQLLNSICRKNTKNLLRYLNLSDLQKIKGIFLKKQQV